MNVILLSLIPMIGYGIYDFVISKPSRSISSSTLMFLIVLSNLLIFSLILLLSGQQITISLEVIYMFFAAITGYVGLLFYSRSLKTGYAGINSSIANSFPAITICIGYFFFKEYLTLVQLWFLVCILLGIIFSSFHISELRSLSFSKTKTSLFYALGASCMWAIYVTCIDISVRYFHPVAVSWFVDVFGLILILPLVILKRGSIFSEIKIISQRNYIYIGILAVLAGFSSIAFGFAFSLGGLAVVSSIAACSPAVTTIFARVFGGEKLEIVQYGAISLLVFGIAGLSYFSI